MKDPVSIQRIALLHPKIIPRMTAFINDTEALTNSVWRIVQGFRTWNEQTILYNQGRTTPGEIVTYSPAGASYHCYGCAADVVELINGVPNWHFDYSKLRLIAQKYSLQMGLDFPHPDYDHFEDKFGIGWREMYHRYITNDFIPNTHFIRL